MKFYLKTIEQRDFALGFIVACEKKEDVDNIIESHFNCISVLSGSTYIYEISEKNADEHGVGNNNNYKCVFGYHIIVPYMKVKNEKIT